MVNLCLDVHTFIEVNKMEDDFVVMLNNTFICITKDYNEAKEFYDKQIENWKKLYTNKPIDNNDKLIFKNYSEDIIINQFSKMDLI